MTRSLKRIALVVALGTLISKIGGLVRQLVIAGAFGVSASYDAYNYAYVLPGFFLILLGGGNGPFHNAIVSALSGKNEKESAYILTAVKTFVSTILLIIAAFLVFAANPIISIIGPGLSPEIHKIAVIQLQIMAPIALFSGLIGIGFGSLNTRDDFMIPAISPVFSSLVLILLIGIFWLQEGSLVQSNQVAIRGGVILAIGTLIGALLQWLIQLPYLFKKGLTRLQFTWDLHHPGVKEVLRILGPAILSSGMLTINVFTDLFFASGIKGAAAGLSYANFIVQAPLGLLSNSLLIPLLPTFAKLNNAKDRESLIERVRQGLILSSTSMIALGTIFITLGTSIVSLIYERGAFEGNAVNIVSSLLIAYGVGMPAYLGRDLLVRVFYALGDAKTPFNLSVIGIILNAVFDWILIGAPTPTGNQMPFNFGAPGLILATGAINFLTCIALLVKLNSHLGRLPIKAWLFDILKLLIAGFIAGLVALTINSSVNWPDGFIGNLTKLLISGSISLFIFGLIGDSMGIKEVKDLNKLISKKVINR